MSKLIQAPKTPLDPRGFKYRIDFKILLISYKALNGLAPQYLSELLSHCSPPRPLRSQNSGHLIIPRISKSTAGGRSFFYLVPKLWKNLPNNVREADTLCLVAGVSIFTFNIIQHNLQQLEHFHQVSQWVPH